MEGRALQGLDAGRITLDGVDVAAMSRTGLCARMGIVLQDTWLFGWTIRDTVAYGRPGASEADILEAARATYVDRFVKSLPQGYDTRSTMRAPTSQRGRISC